MHSNKIMKAASILPLSTKNSVRLFVHDINDNIPSAVDIDDIRLLKEISNLILSYYGQNNSFILLNKINELLNKEISLKSDIQFISAFGSDAYNINLAFNSNSKLRLGMYGTDIDITKYLTEDIRKAIVEEMKSDLQETLDKISKLKNELFNGGI